jgi:anti-sigma factor RsiW
MTDQPQSFSPDDPRLSAYLLGEMPASERAAFEAELHSHPQALEQLEELRETSSLLREVLEQEPAPALSAAQRFSGAACRGMRTSCSRARSSIVTSGRSGTRSIAYGPGGPIRSPTPTV